MLAAAVAVSGVAAIVCINRFVGFPKAVGHRKYAYQMKEVHVPYDDIDLYGKVLVPEDAERKKFPTVIYAHGAESDYKADMTTLKSLAMSGIACCTFDFYGWTDRSTGPKGTHWFKDVPRGVDDAYEKKVVQQTGDLNAVIDFIKKQSFADSDHLCLLGSSMGGATAAAASVTHSEDIRAVILQYPAINLVPEAEKDEAEYDVNRYTGPVLILQGNADEIVPLEMSEDLYAHYNEKEKNHAEMKIYDGQPHVFHGPYKVQAARDIYDFLERKGGLSE